MSDAHDTARSTRRLDPDPVSILLAALGALGSVASLTSLLDMRTERRAERFKARRTAIRSIGLLREALGEIERGLDDLERLLGRYDRDGGKEQRVLDAPSEFGAYPPLFDFFEFSVYQMIGQRITRAFDRCVADTYEVMDCIEDGALDVPSELLMEMRELQARLNQLRFERRSLAETLSGIRVVAQRMMQIIADFERHLVFDRAS